MSARFPVSIVAVVILAVGWLFLFWLNTQDPTLLQQNPSLRFWFGAIVGIIITIVIGWLRSQKT